jgi:hypothetical protein
VIDVTGQATQAVNYDNLAVKHQSTDTLDVNVTAVAKESGLDSEQTGNTTTVNSAASADAVADQGGDLPTTLITVAIDSSGSMNQNPLSKDSDDDDDDKGPMRIELVLEATVSMLEGVQEQQGSQDVLVQLVDFDNDYSNSWKDPDSKATSLGWYTIGDALTLLNDALDGLENNNYRGVFDPAGGTDYEEAVYAIMNGYQDDKVTTLNGDTQDSIFIISDGENNGGWDEQAVLLLNDLKEVMPPEEHKKITEAMSIKAYNKDRAERFKQSYSKYSPEDVLKMVNSLTPEEIKEYIRYIADRRLLGLHRPLRG